MLYIEWDSKNDLGVPILDEQHRGIVSVINSYHHHVRTRKSKEVLILTWETLNALTKIHFKTEEAYLTDKGYPDLSSHAHLHQALFNTMAQSYKDTLKDEDPEVFLRFLKSWWLHHINEEDRKYATYFGLKS